MKLLFYLFCVKQLQLKAAKFRWCAFTQPHFGSKCRRQLRKYFAKHSSQKKNNIEIFL